MAKVTVTNVNKIYDNGFQAVKNACFVAEDKEFVVLVGPSGCGKTTILRMIAGLETITSGEIKIGETVVNKVLPKDRDIAMVFQNYALYPHMTVYENMAFALKLRKESKAEIDKKVMHAADLLGIQSMLQSRPGQLSGGQRQRVALGRAIVRNPKVFLFDEPLSNLDAKLRVQMRSEIVKLHHTLENTMIYVTHDQVEAMTMADKIVVMKDGVIQQIDAALTVYNSPANLFVAGFIGSPAINVVEGTLKAEGNGLMFTCADYSIALSAQQSEVLAGYKDKSILSGIRPEDIYDSRFDSMAMEPRKVDVVCDIVEPLGNEYIVYLKTKNYNFTARFDPKDLPPMGQNFSVTFDMNKMHFFDKQTEVCLV
jgi:multiple sugar transport system ATP-binding protein